MDSRRRSGSPGNAATTYSALQKLLQTRTNNVQLISKNYLGLTSDKILEIADDGSCHACRSRHYCVQHEEYSAVKALVSEIPQGNRDIMRKTKLRDIKAIGSLPQELAFCVSGIPQGGIGVCVRMNPVSAERWWGPVEGHKVLQNMSHQISTEHTEYLWEIYDGKHIAFYIDGSDVTASNWMRFVRCAFQKEKANMIAIQHGMEIHFQTTRVVTKGEELLVWYAPDCYQVVHGVPVGLRQRHYPPRETTRPYRDHVYPHAPTGHATVVTSMPAQSVLPAIHGSHIATSPPGPLIPQVVMMPRTENSQVGLMPAMQPHWRFMLQQPQPGGGVYPGGDGPTMRLPQQLPRSIPPDVKRNMPRWECSQCGEVFGQRLNMEKHPCSVGEIDKPYRCMMCGLCFPNGQYLQAHVSNECPRAGEGPQDKPYACEYCRKPFTGTTTLMNHIRTHFAERSKRCDACGNEFRSTAALHRHDCREGGGGGGGGDEEDDDDNLRHGHLQPGSSSETHSSGHASSHEHYPQQLATSSSAAAHHIAGGQAALGPRRHSYENARTNASHLPISPTIVQNPGLRPMAQNVPAMPNSRPISGTPSSSSDSSSSASPQRGSVGGNDYDDCDTSSGAEE